MHLNATMPETQTQAVMIPALGFGDTGAASGAIGVAMGCHRLTHAQTDSRDVVVLSSSEGKPRSAILIHNRANQVGV